MASQTQEERDRIKRDRLTAQLRANLQRRKQQARARKTDETPAVMPPEPVARQDETDR
jgi:hypothetical protein